MRVVKYSDKLACDWQYKMGIAKGALNLLVELAIKIKLNGKICQLGRQTTYISKKQFLEICKNQNFVPSNEVLKAISNEKVLEDVVLFKSLGFQQVESIDYSNYENATYIADFNKPLPESLKASYDVIFDGGTLEHIFNFPQCLRNIHAMLKEDGIVIHSAPSHNHVDHGFYMFSPTVFYDWYKANNWEIVTSYIFEYGQSPKNPWIIYDCHPGVIDRLSMGGWGKKLLGIWFVARKTKQSTCDVHPQQSAYLKTWNKQDTVGINQRNSFISKLKAFIKSQPVLFKIISWTITVLMKVRVFSWRPKVVARY